MRIFGCDPGLTYGVSCIEGHGKKDEIQLLYHQQLNGKEMLKNGDGHTQFLTILEELAPDVIAIEDFIGAGPRNIYATTTLKLVGYTIGVASSLGIEHVVQVPQARKPFLPDAKLLIPKKVHAMDSLAHALSYYRRHGR